MGGLMMNSLCIMSQSQTPKALVKQCTKAPFSDMATHYVYAIAPSSRAWVKIGKARSLRSRLASAQVWHIERLAVIGHKACMDSATAIGLERKVSSIFAGDRITGEIFRYQITGKLFEHLDPTPDLASLCLYCDETAVAGMVQCQRHREIAARRTRKRQTKLRAAGLCETCGSPTDGKSACRRHLDEKAAKARLRRRK